MKKIKCDSCKGDGYTAEHDPINCACDDYKNPAVTCPIQVQCVTCQGKGFIIKED